MYSPPHKKYWQGRIDEEDGPLGMRWHQRARLIDLSQRTLPGLPAEQAGVVILGFACDEGVSRNKGRVGAKEGPDAIRLACANLSDHLPENYMLIDGGSIACEDDRLEAAQQELDTIIQKIVASGYFPLILGGGHEVAFPHFVGLFHGLPKDQVIGIVNIDAHFDLRIPTNRSTSGTPFYEIADLCQQHSYPFHYLCIGIQSSSNTKALYQRAKDLEVGFIPIEKLEYSLHEDQAAQLTSFVNQCDEIYLTICLDVFDIAVAPGVSAPSINGLQPSLALEVIELIKSSGKLVSANIAELNPSLDPDSRTAKLAARLAYEIISEPPYI